MKITSRPPELYNAQDERIFRQNVAQKLTQLEQGGASEAVVLSAVMSFAYDGSLKVSLVGNGSVLSLKAAVSTSAFPSPATVVEAAATNAARADLSFVGPYALGDTLYLSALGFTAIDGAGSASAKFDAIAVVAVIQPQLVITITQTTSTANETTFTLVVSSPSGLLSGNALVTVTHQGLTSLYNNTLAASAVDFNATLGATYTFVATTLLSANTGGSAKFVATKTGVGVPVVAHWYGTGVPQPPSLALTVTPDSPSDGTYRLVVTYDGTMTYKINGGTDNNGTGSPQTIDVAQNVFGGKEKEYVFKCVKDQQTITDSVTVPPLTVGTPTLSVGTCTASNAGVVGPPWNRLVVEFSSAGMPSGTTFDVSYNNMIANGVDSSLANASSPVTFNSVTFSATEPGRGAVTVIAQAAGGTILTAVKNKPYLT